jgi:hypothetical protein
MKMIPRVNNDEGDSDIDSDASITVEDVMAVVEEEDDDIVDDDDDSVPGSAHNRMQQRPSSYAGAAADGGGSTGTKKKKQVSFSTIQFYHHLVILGDNPGGMSGPPLSISWDALDTTILCVDDYETLRVKGPRPSQQLALPSANREKILRELGYSRREIRDATALALQGRLRRQRTNQQCKWDRTQEQLEVISRSLFSLSPLGRRKRLGPEILHHSAAAVSSSSSSSSMLPSPVPLKTTETKTTTDRSSRHRRNKTKWLGLGKTSQEDLLDFSPESSTSATLSESFRSYSNLDNSSSSRFNSFNLLLPNIDEL